jgi:transcriptional regulator with XRE-family HTH domain
MTRFDHRGFGRRLRQTRESLALSEEQAAAASGRSVETWRRYEATGRGRITVPLMRLARRFRGRINWPWLFEGGATEGPPTLPTARSEIRRRVH